MSNLSKGPRLLDMKVGQQLDHKFGLVTVTFYRESEDTWTADKTSAGWQSTVLTAKQAGQIQRNELSINDLNWD